MAKSNFLHTKFLPSLYVLVMVFATWTLLYRFPIINRTWLWLLVGCAVSFVIIRPYYRSRIFSALAIYAMLVFINVFLGDFYFKSLPLAFNEIAGLVFVSSATTFFLKNASNKMYNIFLLSFGVIIVYTAIVSYNIDLVFPNAIRSITVTGFGGDQTLVYIYYAMGMGTYTMTHALPVIIPPLVMGIRFGNNIMARMALIICLMATVVYIYLGSATGALLIGLFSLTLSILVRPGTIRKNVTLLTIVSVIFLPLLSEDVLLLLLDKLEDFVGGEGAYMVKIEEFRQYLLTGEQGEDMQARGDLYFNSIENFLSNVIWGTNGEIGGHSAIIDRFATLGLIGVLPFLYFLLHQLKFPIKFINSQYLVFYYIGTLSGVLMLLSKNMGNWDMWLCLLTILPMLMVRLVPQKSDFLIKQ